MKSTKKKATTEFISGKQGESELRVPVIDLATNSKQFTDQKESLRNTILSQLFPPEELKYLAIVKIDKEKTQQGSNAQLKELQFPDGIKRLAAFSSGSNIYYADNSLYEKIRSFFKTDNETAFRYGSLLTSSCLAGLKTLDNDRKPLRVKVVDSQSSDPETRQEAGEFQTGDCHGKISPRLAKIIGSSPNRPFQFRITWMKDWATEGCHTPKVDFIAKGTFLPDRTQTDDRGYDLILDRSSVKGVKKELLDRAIPCGDYSLPKTIIGNRSNASIQQYENSWQLLQWCSEDAIRHDIVPSTSKAAKKLASIQDNPVELKDYLIQQHDRRQEIIAAKEEGISSDEDSEKQERSESRIISLLRADKHGQLLDHPKIASFMRDQLARRWTSLAIKGAINHGSAMAQPCDDLKKGTIVAPHLENGTEVIVTRYPIISKDNIRRYTVDNEQKPELKKYFGCAFIRPDQAMEHHQCDFDGDQLVITPALLMPKIASEIRHANDPERDFKKVTKREKVSYRDSCHTRPEIAVAIGQNNIGRIATAIGRIQTSVNSNPNPKIQSIFQHKKQKLLDDLFDALQIEVDSPKSATRSEDYHPHLAEKVKKWTERYPSYLFDFKKDERLYKSMPLPVGDKNPINVIASEAVNPEWQQCQINSRLRHEFRYLMPSQEELGLDRDTWNEFCDWAREIKEEYINGVRQVKQANGDNSQASKEGIGKIYENLRANIDETFGSDSEQRKIAASAMWNVETTNPNLNVPRKVCCEASRKLQPTFELVDNFQLLHSAIPTDTYVFSVPFQKYSRHNQGHSQGQIKKDDNGKPIVKDFALIWKTNLDRLGIKYEATLHPNLPMVQFALIDPPETTVEQLQQKFGSNRNNSQDINLTYTNNNGEIRDVSNRIVPPSEYTWVESSEDYNPKSSLVVNLFAEEIGERLHEDEYLSQLELVGQKYNEFADVDLCEAESKYQGRTLTFEVGKISENRGKQRQGAPIVKLEGKELAMFSTNSPKLPPGTTFKGTIAPGKSKSSLTLDIDPKSIEHKATASSQLESTTMTQTNARNQTPANQTSAEEPLDVNNTLLKAIEQHHLDTGKVAFSIGDWRALVNKNQKFIVKSSDGDLIFRGDLKNKKITQELSPENQKRFIEMAQQYHERSLDNARKETEALQM